MTLALSYHPTAVGLSGLPEVVWQSEVSAYKAAGVSIVPYAVAPVTVSAPVITDIDGATDNEKYGTMLGDWAIADSGGKAHVLFVNVPSIAILSYVYAGFKTAFTENCPKCTISVENETVADATGSQLTQATVSALQRDSSLNYAVCVDGAFFDGLPSALSAAGIAGRVKIAGQAGDPVDEADLATGKTAAYTGLSATLGGWLMVDAAIRHVEGMTIPTDDGGLPTQLLVKGGQFTVSASYDEPTDYQSLFEQLWHKG
jgi:ribose transport system substrate-binding protein